MKANEIHYFSNLFDKVLYMFRTGPLSIIRSISTLHTRNRYEGWNFNMATIYLQVIQNIYMFRSFTVLQSSHQHCVQLVASDVEVVRYL